MRLNEAGFVAWAGVHCYLAAKRVIPPVGDKWIAYPHAEVLARRARQMVYCLVCVGVPSSELPFPPMPWVSTPSVPPVPVPEPVTPEPVWLVPPRLEELIPGTFQSVSEPSAVALFLVAILVLGYLRARARTKQGNGR